MLGYVVAEQPGQVGEGRGGVGRDVDGSRVVSHARRIARNPTPGAVPKPRGRPFVDGFPAVNNFGAVPRVVLAASGNVDGHAAGNNAVGTAVDPGKGPE